MQSNVSVLIAAKPSRMRDSQYVQLKTVSGINIVGFADDSASSLKMISERRPALVLLVTAWVAWGAFSKAVGILKWRTIIWEVRNY